jgi:polar amino acid transport system permease protein
MWSWEYAWELLPTLLSTLRTVFLATLGGFVLACVLGLALAMLGRSGYQPVRAATRAFVEFIRNTPLLVQLFFLYYALPEVMTGAPSAMTTGIIGLGLHYSTYLSEVYRSGIEGVPRGQWEAARALNLSRPATWLTIIMPQALPPIIPVMGNYLIVIFKETPLLSAITLVELVLAAKNEISHSFRPFEPFTLVGVIFLMISLLLSLGVRWLERRMNRDRSQQQKHVNVSAKQEVIQANESA